MFMFNNESWNFQFYSQHIVSSYLKCESIGEWKQFSFRSNILFACGDRIGIYIVFDIEGGMVIQDAIV